MGYSCTQDASHMLGTIRHFYANGTGNGLKIGATEYFFEIGKEQYDGAVTGRLLEMLPGDYAQKVGSFRIEPDGQIARFPRISKVDREQITSLFADLQARNPKLLRSWSYGCI